MLVCETKWVQSDSGHAQRPPARTEYLIFLAVRDQDETWDEGSDGSFSVEYDSFEWVGVVLVFPRAERRFAMGM
jgi:hypothetical protein